MTTLGDQHRTSTFKPRRRPLSPSRRALFERLSVSLCLPVDGPRFDPVGEFGGAAPLVLDIGIGSGHALTTQAAAEPGIDVIGADVHTPGIASTLARIESMGLANVRLVHGDALRFADRLAPGSLDGIRIYFPDPWPKARHRNRRMVSAANVDLFYRLLAPGGTLHLATDIDDYADMVLSLCGGHADLDGGVVDRPAERPVTRYERKGLDAGRVVTDLIYRRRAR
ncbi:tRNA (guanosine(46)-N7)-methyltransferase TrmB [Ilumatobacter sp.]|uniref:tRNA (guanosine(46)-N7)-methyltransferase TrmB n=1 Tax=Ilumatobacter sp. TaxID=1967498 RepID=UPI003AF7E97D